MGFFRDLLRRLRREPPPPAAPSPDEPPTEVDGPRLVGGPDDSTPMVAVAQGNATVLMDRLTYEYQAGLARGDDPSQGALDAALARADRVRVLAGGLYREEALGVEILAEEHDPAVIADLLKALRIVEDPSTFDHCACLGHPTLEFYAGTEFLGAVALHHGRSIRWPLWKHDARLADPSSLTAWMIVHGLEESDVTAQGNGGDVLSLLALTPGRRHAGRADSYRRRGDRERALAECARALREDPSLGVARAIQSSVLHEMGKQDEAFAAAERAIELGFEPPEFRIELANTYQEAGRAERALELCDEVIARDPSIAAAYDVRGLALLKLDRHEDGLEAFLKAEQLAPDWPPACWHVAMTKAVGDDHAGAVEAFTRFLALLDGPSTPPDGPSMRALAHALRGRSRLALGEVPAGREDGAEAIRLDPDHPEGYRTRGMALEMMGRPREAMTDYADLLRLRPEDDPDPLRRMASAQSGAGDFEGLLETVDRLLSLQPEDVEARFAQAQALLNLDRPSDAVETLNEALHLRPDSALGYAMRAFCWKRLERADLHADDLESALRWEPDNPALLNNSAWLLATSPDPDLRDGKKALARATKAKEITEGKVSFVLGTLSAALAECGRMDEARSTLRAALALEAPPEIRSIQNAMREAFEAGEPYRSEE